MKSLTGVEGAVDGQAVLSEAHNAELRGLQVWQVQQLMPYTAYLEEAAVSVVRCSHITASTRLQQAAPGRAGQRWR